MVDHGVMDSLSKNEAGRADVDSTALSCRFFEGIFFFLPSREVVRQVLWICTRSKYEVF